MEHFSALLIIVLPHNIILNCFCGLSSWLYYLHYVCRDLSIIVESYIYAIYLLADVQISVATGKIFELRHSMAFMY